MADTGLDVDRSNTDTNMDDAAVSHPDILAGSAAKPGVPGLANLPAEIITQIFHEVYEDVAHKPRPMARLAHMAMVDKRIYSIVKKSERAHFRRAAIDALNDNYCPQDRKPCIVINCNGEQQLFNDTVDHADLPDFVDVLLKACALKFMENRPPDPDQVLDILQRLQRDREPKPEVGEFVPYSPEMSIELHPKHFHDALDWLSNRHLRGQLLVTDYQNGHRLPWRERPWAGPGVPEATILGHPFDLEHLDVTTYYDERFPDGFLVKVDKEALAVFYIDHLMFMADLWRQHVQTPWTAAETEYKNRIRVTGEPEWMPCCPAPDCPRRPYDPGRSF